ncbi:MAG: glycosyltransferase, partial [Candidatus Electrothrix sp. AR4]|nr:glycosyltransferase [Candidatus Electrothrix sp. AR4]
RRGPRWMTENGLEWLARLLIEPKRLWKRYVIGNTVFLYWILKV